MASITGISTVGIKLGYAVETTKGTKPTAFKWLERCSEIGGLSVETEPLDASCLEDAVTKYIKGRQDTGGTWSVTFNRTDEIIAAIQAAMTASKTGRSTGLMTWFEVWSPHSEQGFYVKAEFPDVLPLSDLGQNAVETMALTLTINEYVGYEEGIEPTAASSVA